MSPNRFRPHVLVLPEDDANRQIANGFILHPRINGRAVQILRPAGGWPRIIHYLKDDLVPALGRYDQMRVVILVDFDGQHEERFYRIKVEIPEELHERVFIVGALSNPEDLRRDVGKTFEQIGAGLARDCVENTRLLWGVSGLSHNQRELERLMSLVKPFVFTHA